MSEPTVPNQALRNLRLATQARIGLGRAGVGLPTQPMLDFQMAHAMARDAVHTCMSDATVASGLAAAPIRVDSQASGRAVYLQRPDLGRRLDNDSARRLSVAADRCDAVIVIADGLSATAVHRHGATMAARLSARLTGWRLAPIILAHQARVALADDIGERLGAELAVILIGERPGLTATDSLGAYITWRPQIGRMDSERNCVSNIRPPHGLSYELAVDKVVWLMQAARTRRITGVSLKEEHDASALAGPGLDEGPL